MIAVLNRLRSYFFRLLSLGGLIGILAVAGCGSPTVATTVTATATATATQVSAANTRYTSTTATYAIDYPKSWTIQPIDSSSTPGGAAFSLLQIGEVLAITPLTTTIPTNQYAQVAHGFLTGIKATDIKLPTTGSAATLPSGTWTTLVGTMTLNGVAYTFSELGTDHGGMTFFVYVIAPTVTANADTATYFQPMLSSFTFLK